MKKLKKSTRKSSKPFVIQNLDVEVSHGSSNDPDHHHHHRHHRHHHHHHRHHHHDHESSSVLDKESSTPWLALGSDPHPMLNEIEQEGTQSSTTKQISEESIHVKDSCNVNIVTTDTKAAVNLQVAIQLAIVLVLSLTIASADRAEQITQEMIQRIQVKQTSDQKLIIENSRDVEVTTTDTEISVNIQLLLQILLALIAKIEIL